MGLLLVEGLLVLMSGPVRGVMSDYCIFGYCFVDKLIISVVKYPFPCFDVAAHEQPLVGIWLNPPSTSYKRGMHHYLGGGIITWYIAKVGEALAK